jgi:hypothetical protein
VLRVRVSSCVVKRNSTRGGVCWGGPYHADPPATDGPSLHTFGETQTLEARAVFVIPSCLLVALRVRRSTAGRARRIQRAQQLTRAAPNAPLSDVRAGPPRRLPSP